MKKKSSAHDNPKIIAADKSHLPLFTDIIQRTFTEYGWIFVAKDEVPDFFRFEQDYLTGQNKLFALTIDSKTIGCIAIISGSFESVNGPIMKAARLSRVYIDENYRGRGFGNFMLDFVKNEIMKSDVEVINLWTDTRFIVAHSMYEKAGYVRTGNLRALHDVNISFEVEYILVLKNSD